MYREPFNDTKKHILQDCELDPETYCSRYGIPIAQKDTLRATLREAQFQMNRSIARRAIERGKILELDSIERGAKYF